MAAQRSISPNAGGPQPRGTADACPQSALPLPNGNSAAGHSKSRISALDMTKQVRETGPGEQRP